MIRNFLTIVLIVFTSGTALADEPLAAPETNITCSASGKFCVTSDVVAGMTYLKAKSTGKLLWSIPGWHRWIFVADDGQSIAIGYDGMNLVPRDVKLREPVIHLYRGGKLIRTVVLGDFFHSKSELTQTVSHYAWGSIQGFNRSNQLVVALVNGKYIAFDAHTGKQEMPRSDG